MGDVVWFTQEIYPNLLKFLLNDSLRTVAVTITEDSVIHDGFVLDCIFLYDPECMPCVPYYGLNIYNLETIDIHNTDKTIYLIGDISTKGMNILLKKKIPQTIYGITPLYKQDTQAQKILHHRLNFFSKTILAGSLNIQLPFIEHYFWAGLSPFSFYHLLYRTQYPHIIIKNALCLLNNTQPTFKINDYVDYQRVLSHTDLHIESDNSMQDQKYVDYLRLLSIIG
jgi:hypothetical protein